MKSRPGPAAQRGSMLLEALIAIVLFSIGILGLIGLQAVAIKNTADAKYRTEAAFLVNQIIGQMWSVDPAALASYAHRPMTVGTCNFSGASGNPNVMAWLGTATTAGTVLGNLPGATVATQQITIEPGNRVTVTVCWRAPQEVVPHSYVAVAQING